MTPLYILIGVLTLIVAAVGFYFIALRKPAPEKELPTKRDEAKATLAASAAATPNVVKKVPPSIRPDGEVAETRSPSPSKVSADERRGAQPQSQSVTMQVDANELVEPSVKRDVAGVRKGLAATRGGFIARLAAIFTGKREIDPNLLSELEEVMLTSDVGVKTTQAILDRLRERLAKNELSDSDAVWAALRAEATRILTVSGAPRTMNLDQKPSIVLVVGVNGVGKTTTIGKLATRFVGQGKRVVLAAGDTFRAAAVQQLEVWGKRVGAEVIRGKEGADPGAVAYEATQKSTEAKADLLFVDTAGRLHTKAPLMDEIRKVRKTIDKARPGAPHETLLVLDATTGQNGLSQATLFKEAIDLTGIVLTKLDGTAKGGIVLAVCDELKLPVRFIGLGERAEDLREFHAEEFVEALFGDRSADVAAS